MSRKRVLMLSVSFLLQSTAVRADDAPQLASLDIPESCLTARPPKNSYDSWDKFEAEFGISQNDPTLIRGNIRRAKYSLDLMTFTFTSFLDGAKRNLELEYSQGTIQRAVRVRRDPAKRRARPHAFEDTRLKFDIDLTTAKPYLGLRLVIPIGN